MKTIKLSAIMIFILMLSIAFSACGGGGSSSTGDDGDDGNGEETGTFVYAGDYYGSQYWKNGEMVFLGMNMGRIYDIKVVGNDVYAAGAIRDGSYYRAGYWKNDTWTELNSDNEDSYATTMVIDNGDVYTAGYVGTADGYCWKNGSELSHETSTSSYINAMAIEGDYLFFGGKRRYSSQTNAGELTYDFQNPDPDFDFTWYTTTAFGSSYAWEINSEVYSVAAVNNEGTIEVYAAGYSADTAIVTSATDIAGYWYGEITGSRTWYEVSDKSTDACIYSLVIDNDIFYAGGYLTSSSSGKKTAGYWKDDVWTGLGDGTTHSEVRSLVVDGDDIYAGGYVANSSGYLVAGYWLNGTWVRLGKENSLFNSMVTSLAVVHK